MPKTVDLSGYLPQSIKEYREMQYIVNAENPEFQTGENTAEIICNAGFIELADEVFIERYEDMLGIKKLPTATLEERRFDILVKFNETPPFTMQVLKHRLKMLCGDDYTVIHIPEEYALTIGLGVDGMTKYKAVEKMVKNIVPANLVVTISEMYNRHSMLYEYTYGDLEEYTHYQLRNEVFE